MKKVSFILFILSLFFVSCDGSLINPVIDYAEFKGDYKTIVVHYKFLPTNYDVDVLVYKNPDSSHYEEYSVRARFTDSFKETAELRLEKEITKGAKVHIVPDPFNDELYGSCYLYREN